MMPRCKRRKAMRVKWRMALIAFFMMLPTCLWPQTSTPTELDAAAVAEKAKRYSEAAEHYQKFLMDHPASLTPAAIAEVRAHLATDQFMLNHYEDSLRTLSPLLHSKGGKPATVRSQVWIVAGLDELQLNSLDNAIHDLRQGLRANPASGTARLALGDALARSGRLREAVQEYREQTRRTPGVVDAWYKIGVAEAQLAQKALEDLEHRGTPGPVRRLLVAEEFLDRGQGLDAANTLLPMVGSRIAREAYLPGLHSDLGEAFLEENDVQPAQDEFRTEIRLNPESAPAWFGLAEVDALDSRWDRALSRIRHLMLAHPHYLANQLQAQPPGPLRMAWTRDRLRMPESLARTSEGGLLQAWIEMGAASLKSQPSREDFCPSLPTRQASSPGLWLTEGCYARLTQELRSKKALSAIEIVKLAEAEFRLGHYEAAQTAALHLLKTQTMEDRTSAWATYWLIRSDQMLSLNALERASTINPNSPRVRQLLAEDYASHDRWKKAIEEYQAALRLAPSLADLHLGLGTVYWQAGDWMKAQAELRQALRIAPASTVAAYELGDTEINLHSWREAIRYLTKALTNSKVARKVRLDLAKAESELGQDREALTELEALEADDPDGEIHFRMGMIYRKLGDLEKARDALAESEKLRRLSDARAEERMKQVQQERKRLDQAEERDSH
jgi:tetratricopeptide (TPR) repeat protein